MQQNITNITTNVNRSIGTYEPKADVSGIVTACGSLGKKFELLYEKKMFNVIAQDIVSVTLNKLAVVGAEFAGFSEYISADSKENAEEIERNIACELKKYNCTPMSVKIEISDKTNAICGMAMGINPVSKEPVESGDIVIGLVSDGLHFNGYEKIVDWDDAEILDSLKPAYNYYNDIMYLYKKGKIKLGVNITKGGICHCINKVLPKGLKANLNLKHIPPQPIFDKLREITGEEYYRFSNAGIGFCLITDRASNEIFFEACQKYDPLVLGVIE